MKLNLAKYVVILFFLASCGMENKQLIEYGYITKSNDSLSVSIRVSEFKTYGEFLNRLNKIVCNDSIPKVVIENDKNIRNIYPLEFCNPPLANPRPRNTFYINKDSIYKNYRKIAPKELSSIMKSNFENLEQDIELAEKPEKILFIFEFYVKEKSIGVENYLELITKSYDLLNTKNELKIIFGPRIDIIPIFENGQLRYEQVE